MKKILVIVSLLSILIVSGCGNKDMGLGNYDYNYVSCSGVVELYNEPITSWKDSDDGEQIEFTLKSNGNNILTSVNYCVLSKELLGGKSNE